MVKYEVLRWNWCKDLMNKPELDGKGGNIYRDMGKMLEKIPFLD
jgi:hypothetical protein